VSAAAAPHKAWTLVLASLGMLLPKWIGRPVLAAAGV
jgi:hypothetical protein